MKKCSHIFLLESQTALLEVPKTPEGECEQEIKPGAESPSATALPSLCCSKVYEARCTAYLEPALKFFIRLLTSVDAARELGRGSKTPSITAPLTRLPAATCLYCQMTGAGSRVSHNVSQRPQALPLDEWKQLNLPVGYLASLRWEG